VLVWTLTFALGLLRDIEEDVVPDVRRDVARTTPKERHAVERGVNGWSSSSPAWTTP
jgi:hypothetical protein